MDTVPEEGMTIEPFGGVVEGGKLYGRGACDVKASVAAMAVALERLERERPAGAAGVVLALTADEEFTHKGSSALAEMDLGVELGIVAEPTGFDIVIGHKGAVRFEVVVAGESCHSSAPHRGKNAIYKMARVVEALESLGHELARSAANDLLGRPTLSVGRIEGGQAVNVVPDWCRIEVDRRLIPGETPGHAMDQARAWIGERVGSMGDVVLRSMGIEMTALEPRVGAEDLGAMAEAIRRATGMTPKTIGVPYGTDAGPLSQKGLKCVVLGPGDIAQAHTRDEWVELEQVRQGVEVYFELARTLG
jgi:acetylornithine deacetylase